MTYLSSERCGWSVNSPMAGKHIRAKILNLWFKEMPWKQTSFR